MVEVDEEEEVVVVVVAAAAAVVVEVAAAVPRTETRLQELVDRRLELVRLGLVVHTAHWRQQVQSPRTKPETRKN